MDQRAEISAAAGYRPYPPTNDRQVAWVKTHVGDIQRLAAVPEDTSAHRNGISLIIGKFLSLYLTTGQNDFKTAAKRQETVIQAFQDDLIKFPLWAIEDGLRAYRTSPSGKWAPKVSGEVIDFISIEMQKPAKVLKNCRRILTANERGLNIDFMANQLKAIADEKDKAEAALQMMNQLERACDILVDPVAKGFYYKCNDTFHNWRIANAKKLVDDAAQNENQEAGADDTDRDIFPLNPPDGGAEAP